MTTTMSMKTVGGSVGSPRPSAFLYRNAMLILLGVLVVAAACVYPNFLTPANISLILVQNAGLGVIAIAMTFLMVTGAFDLSVVPVFVGGGAVYAVLSSTVHWSIALLAALAVGATAGLVNGIVVTRFKVNSFIATLATASVYSGIAVALMGTNIINIQSPSARYLGTGTVAGVPMPIVILVALFVIGQLVLGLTPYGRRLMSIGGSEEASRLAGLRVNGLRLSAYLIVGASAAFAGVLFASKLGAIQSTQLNSSADLLLNAIAVVVVGGTSLYGGEGSVWRTAIGLIVFAVLDNVLAGINAGQPAVAITKGCVIILAVITDAQARKRSG
ncbi:ABC transporter permease [Microbacterium sp. LWH7-1.2]|uniref:ABC transporter permease n=1 Tax=Microbacterium sp. LWH7-1.2 TaxID=3135257 RepID=UPI003138BF32